MSRYVRERLAEIEGWEPPTPKPYTFSPAIIGLMQSLPPWGQDFPPGGRKAFLNALEKILDAIYPTEAQVCVKCGEPFTMAVFLIDGVGAVCHRRHPGDPPEWDVKPLTLAERLAFFKESKRTAESESDGRS